MNVEDLLKSKKIPYTFSGRDLVIQCLNPKHEDSTPSMKVDKILGIFHCFSCGYKGNLYYTFDEAYDKLAILREKLKRQIEDVRSASIGLNFPTAIQWVDYDYRVSKETLQEFEAFKSIGPDYEGRITFPLRDIKNNIVGFIGKAEDQFAAKKYLITPPNTKKPLFPLHKFKPYNGRALLVEGIFDLLNLYDNGFNNVICLLGINSINKEKLNMLKILGVTGIDICLDPDKAGQDAAEKIKELAEEQYFHVRNINLKSDDPGALTQDKALKLKTRLYGE